ncbi:MAG: glycosyltransferase [Anaerococcus sp.]|nr:glycosyltransferase [Anaerococcus sp.]
MANYNTNKDHLKLAIDSILKQTYKDFELIIVDDKSTDDSLEFLRSYESKYPQIKILVNEKNQGLAYSLNKALAFAKGSYIARMDTDDISFPDRFEKEVFYLENHKDVDILGTFAKEFDQGHKLKFATFTNSYDTKSLLLFTNCLFHPTVMIRKAFLDKTGLRYDPYFLTSQDYDFWARASHFGNIEVLKEVLLLYRIHGGQITDKKKERVMKYTKEISLRELSKLGLSPQGEDLEAQLVLCRQVEISDENIDKVITWSKKILKANFDKNIYNASSLKRVISFRLFTMISKANISFSKKIKALYQIKAFNKFNLGQIFTRLDYKNSYKKNKERLGLELERGK